nr:immunoglobulin light chain junction region [Homo sapiens]
CQQRSTITF